MKSTFSKILKQKRTELGISQKELAARLFVTNATVARWENGSRMPDAAMIAKIADLLGMNVALLINATLQANKKPNVILADDEKIILNGGIPILKSVLPGANIEGFTKPSEAIEYAKCNKVDLAFLDIEMGRISGLDVCRALLKSNPKTNVIYLTAYPDYALDAWDTGASGFMIKPLTADGVSEQLAKLRYPFITEGVLK